MTALAVILIVVAGIAGVSAIAVLIGRGTRLGDRQAGITDEQQDADQIRWLRERKRGMP